MTSVFSEVEGEESTDELVPVGVLVLEERWYRDKKCWGHFAQFYGFLQLSCAGTELEDGYLSRIVVLLGTFEKIR